MTAEAIYLAPLQEEDVGPLAWQTQALCAQTDPEAFFPEKGGSTREAKRICIGCEVKAECLQYALDQDERFGIWGGLSERERRRLKRADGTVASPVVIDLPVLRPDLEGPDAEDLLAIEEGPESPEMLLAEEPTMPEPPTPLPRTTLVPGFETGGPRYPAEPVYDTPPSAKPRLTRAQRERMRDLVDQGYSPERSTQLALAGR